MQVPVVNTTPLRSLEQMGPLLVFVGFQARNSFGAQFIRRNSARNSRRNSVQVSDGHRLPLQALEYVEVQRRKKNLGWLGVLKLRIQLAAVVGALLFGVAAVLYPTGYFGPISSRIRSLFVKHTRTGNPLVDSVAEHQPASAQAYKQYLSKVYDIAPWGFVFSFLNLSDANTFVILYAIVAYYFSSKMARLVILLGPVSSALGGARRNTGAIRRNSAQFCAIL